MKFSELVRLLGREGFSLVKEKGLDPVLRQGWSSTPDSCRFSWREGSADRDVSRNFESGRTETMITLPYSLIIEATEDAEFFGFYSPDLEGFTGVGHSIEDCLYKARWGMADHTQTLREQGLPVPTPNSNPTIVIQNEPKLQLA
jgi:predicted RNase H-like HicB family nuclease